MMLKKYIISSGGATGWATIDPPTIEPPTTEPPIFDFLMFGSLVV